MNRREALKIIGIGTTAALIRSSTAFAGGGDPFGPKVDEPKRDKRGDQAPETNRKPDKDMGEVVIFVSETAVIGTAAALAATILSRSR
jgi:hypothetical protein